MESGKTKESVKGVFNFLVSPLTGKELYEYREAFPNDLYFIKNPRTLILGNPTVYHVGDKEITDENFLITMEPFMLRLLIDIRKIIHKGESLAHLYLLEGIVKNGVMSPIHKTIE